MAAAGGLGPWLGRAPGAEPGRAEPSRAGGAADSPGRVHSSGSEEGLRTVPGDPDKKEVQSRRVASGSRRRPESVMLASRSRGNLDGPVQEDPRRERAQSQRSRGRRTGTRGRKWSSFGVYSNPAVRRGPGSDPGIGVRAPSGVEGKILQRRSRTHFCCPQRWRGRSGREGRDRPPACQSFGPAPSHRSPTHRPSGALVQSREDSARV